MGKHEQCNVNICIGGKVMSKATGAKYDCPECLICELRDSQPPCNDLSIQIDTNVKIAGFDHRISSDTDFNRSDEKIANQLFSEDGDLDCNEGMDCNYPTCTSDGCVETKAYLEAEAAHNIRLEKEHEARKKLDSLELPESFNKIGGVEVTTDLMRHIDTLTGHISALKGAQSIAKHVKRSDYIDFNGFRSTIGNEHISNEDITNAINTWAVDHVASKVDKLENIVTDLKKTLKELI